MSDSSSDCTQETGYLGLVVLLVIAPAVARVRVGSRLVARSIRARQHQPVLQLAGRLEDVQWIVRQLLQQANTAAEHQI